MKNILTVDALKANVLYDPTTGVFTRLKNHPKRKYVAGSITGVLRPDGYVQVMVDGKIFLAHRLAWLYVHGAMPEHYIDHINGIKNDNRIENLRDVYQNVNIQNQKRAKRNRTSSSMLGVSFCNQGRNKDKPYRARIVVDHKEIHLGTFSQEQDAHAAYLDAKRKYHEGCTI
jgi:hypothetical protein